MFPPRPAEFPRLLGSFLLHLPGWWSDPGSGFSASREEDGTLLAAPIFIPMGCHQQHWGLMQETLANTGIYAIAIGTKLDLCNINGDLTNENGYLSNEHGDTSNKNVALTNENWVVANENWNLSNKNVGEFAKAWWVSVGTHIHWVTHSFDTWVKYGLSHTLVGGLEHEVYFSIYIYIYME